MVTWILYATFVSALVAGAAALLERAVRARSVPTRWIWAGAMVLSLGIPALAWSLAGAEATGAVALGTPEIVAEGATAGPADDASWWAVDPSALLAPLDPAVRWLWPLGSLLLLGTFVASAFRLGRSARRWRPTRLDGFRVRVSHAVGPAVVGVLRPEVVLPSWILDLTPEDRSLVVRHEREHLAARDPWLVLAGFTALVALPWNVALWWQFARLRAAVELDCDHRVLRGRSWAERRRYGELLLQVGERMATGAHRPAFAAFAERGTSLERRIRAMFDVTQLLSPKRLVVWAVAGAVLGLATTLVPRPERQVRTVVVVPDASAPTIEVIEVEPEIEPPPAPEASGRPTFTPYTVGPEITNRAEAQRALAELYPPLLRDAGIGGTVRVWFHIDDEGTVTDTRLVDSSGHPQLDEAALAVADRMEFSPALNRDEPTPVWVQFPITFTVR